MKRSYEDRVYLGSKSRKHSGHKPNRNSFGIHKTKRHLVNKIEDQLIEQELIEQYEEEQEALFNDYWYDEERFQTESENH